MKKIFLSVFVISILSACESAKLITTWNAGESSEDSAHISLPVHFKKILVVGIFNDKDRAIREASEDAFAQQLGNASFSPLTAMSIYGPQSFDSTTPEQALEKISDSLVDGVLTIEPVDMNNQSNYRTRPGVYRPPGMYYNPMYGGYGYRPYGRFGGGGRRYYQPTPTLTIEANIYILKTRKLVYSAQIQTDATSNAQDIANASAKSIMKDIRENNIFK